MANPPRSPTTHPRVRAVGATIQLLKHAPTEAIAPVLLQSQRVSKKPDPQRWDRADGQAFDDLSLPEKCAPIAHGSEGRAYSSPSNPGRAASPIYSDLICDRHRGVAGALVGFALAVTLGDVAGERLLAGVQWARLRNCEAAN